jgi:signal transduction histidine kinase
MASAKGEFLGAVGLFEDISERKRAEAERNRLEQRLQQAQKAESLGRMAASVAHHFNNTLMVVTGNLELVLDDLPEEGDAVDCIREAMKASHRAVEVSRLMLAYLGQTFVKKERLDLAEYSGEVLALEDVTNGRSVRLNTDMPSPGPIILGQPLHIKQILTNLISNAVEAIGEREGNVAVSVRTVSKEEIQELQFHPLDWQPSLTSYVCLSVSDNGCGMDEPTIGKIFDPFFTTKFLGRGLGLAVVLGLVRAHEGAITVESRQGRGSTFRVFFPLISS